MSSTNQNIITLDKEFEKFWQKIENGENFAFMRNADGERAIMTGTAVAAQEGNWKSPDYVSKLGKDIYKSLSIDDDNAFYAVSCPCCDPEAYYWYVSRIPSKNITFSNLWINANYNKFIEKFEVLTRDAVLISNFRAENHKIGNLNIIKHYKINDDCIGFWENEAPSMLEQIKQDFGKRNNLLYVVSAGPMSGPIIANLFKNNPNNCYVDFGSAIDKYYREGLTRPYMQKGNIYAERNCWMYDPQKTDFDVSVVLTLYKRPENLDKQLEAIENQTLKPKEILLFQDGINDEYKIELSQELKDRFNLVEISPENRGVWERFRFAQKAKSRYICLFDDDTIPGMRWLENCHTEMLKKEGLYGTIGILMEEPEKYAYGGFVRVGWDGPLNSTTEVDLVGHSWFFKKDWIKYLFEGTEDFQKLKTASEDMCFSAQLQKKSIKTFVPPHPTNNTTLWGSLPNYAMKLGQSSCALSFTSENHKKMNWAVNELLTEGWKPIIKTKPEYVKKIKFQLKPLPAKESFKLFGKVKDGKKRTLYIFGFKIKWEKK